MMISMDLHFAVAAVLTLLCLPRMFNCFPATVTSGFETETDFSEWLTEEPFDAAGSSVVYVSSSVDELTTMEPTLAVNDSIPRGCRLRATNPQQVYSEIRYLLDTDKLKLIEYKLNFTGYTENPMRTNMTYHHKADLWARVSSSHGQTLLSLAFNYGILSLRTLTFGTDEKDINLEDEPIGCFGELGEEQKIELVQLLLMSDFKEDGTISLKKGERVCHEYIQNYSGYAKFTDQCCYFDSTTNETQCSQSVANEWLQFLYVLLSSIRFGVLFFGPLMFFSAVGSLTREEVPYTVKLKDPLIRTVMLCKPEDIIDDDIKTKQYLDLHNKRARDLPKLMESFYNLQDNLPPGNGGLSAATGQPFQAKISGYDIMVNYKRLLAENKVPIGFWKSIIRSIFYCKLRNVGPFVDCCKQNMFRHRMCSCIRTSVPWIKFWRKVGLALIVLLLPTPYYIRLLVFYFSYEYEEVILRKEAVARLGLKESFENSLVQYLLPTHPVFICIYVTYGVMAITLAYMARRTEEGRFRKIIVGAFTDLKHLSWIDVLNMMVSNVIWPFKKYGVVALLVIFIYWPIALPITLIVSAFYCLPTIYLTLRMFFYSKRAFLEKIQKRTKRRYRVRRKVDNSLHLFHMENIFKLLWGGDDEDEILRRRDAGSGHGSVRRQRSVRLSDGYELDEVDNLNPARLQRFRSVSVASTIVRSQECNWRRVLEHLFASLLCVVALYSALFIMSECVGCLVEIMVFTMMGIIVNAGAYLKYIALVILIVVYSYDCFNNVEKKYLKLNKALFNEVKSRIKDLEKVTSLPSFLQENRGFKSQELNEQAEYEMPDDIVGKPPRHWLINDLVLFIDNEDMPRIPRKLFEDVCEIRVAGVPGPIYLGLLFALKQFLKIAIFVGFIFLVILSFGNFYGLSETNQLLAALAGGSLPLIMRTFMEPDKPDIEMGTVSFKSKLDEIIKNFAQYWPVYDFAFELNVPEEEKKNDDGSGKEPDSISERRPSTPMIHVYPPCDDDIPNGSSDSFPFNTLHTTTSFTHLGTLTRQNNSITPRGSVCSIRNSVEEKKDPADGGKGARVCFQETPPQREVDIVIYLPTRCDEIWLEEWSDLGDDVIVTNKHDVVDRKSKTLNV